jgi:hypothetical protein
LIVMVGWASLIYRINAEEQVLGCRQDSEQSIACSRGVDRGYEAATKDNSYGDLATLVGGQH